MRNFAIAGTLLVAALFAPSVLMAADEHQHATDHAAHAGMNMDTAEMHTMVIGALELSGAYTRAMPPRARTGGGFVTITNKGTESDRLVSASSPAAPHVEIHMMSMNNDVMVMRRMEDPLDIPAGEAVQLKPGGLHIMFIDVPVAFVKGEMVEVTLTFEHAGDVTLHMPVGALGSKEMPEMNHDHSGHHAQ